LILRIMIEAPISPINPPEIVVAINSFMSWTFLK